MATAGTALASGGYGIGRPSRSEEPRRLIPRLDVRAGVNGVASVGDGLVAVGGHLDHGAAQPVVWTHRLGEPSWSLSASDAAFPPHAVLAAVAGIGETIVAVGHVPQLSGVQAIIDDSSGRPVHVPILASVPAIFRSQDGRRWEHVVRGAPGSPLGAFGAVAPIGDRVVAVGSRFLEPGVSEGYGLIVMASEDGSTWESTELLGVAPPRHGAVTLLARLGESAVLATREIRDSIIYMSSGSWWKPVDGPAPGISYTAAGGNDRSVILAGVDHSGVHRVWRRSGQGWREVEQLPGIQAGARLTEVEIIGGSLVVAGSLRGRGFVVDTGR
jgi:hypothetical protein